MGMARRRFDMLTERARLALDLAKPRVLEERKGHPPGRHARADLLEELGEDSHLVLRRAAAETGLAGDAIGVDLDGRGAAALDREPQVAIATELDVLDHRRHGLLDVLDRLGRER